MRELVILRPLFWRRLVACFGPEERVGWGDQPELVVEDPHQLLEFTRLGRVA